MQETNERLLTDSSAENNLTISPVDNFAFARILSLLDQELISLSAVQIEDGLTAAGKQVKVIKGSSRVLGMMVPVTITLGEDAGLPFAFLDCEVPGVDLFQLGQTLIPFNIESFKDVSLPFFPKLSLHAAAKSGLNNEYLKITAQIPEVWNPLGLEGFSLKDISLNALKEILPISLRYLHSAIFEASLVIKDKVVPVAVTIPLGAKGWRIKVAPSTILPSLADLVGLIAGDDVVNALPEAIRDLPSLKINTLDISFDPGIPRLLALTLDVASAGSWQFCSELSVETVQLQLEMVYDSTVARFPYAVSGRISGKMRVGRLYFLASVPYPLNGTTFLETGTVTALPSLGELFSLIGLDDFSAVLPKGIAESGAMNIESLGVALNLQEQQLERFNVAVKAANKWPLLPGKIEIINFGLGLTIDRQNTSWGISGRIYGTASIFNTLVSISCGRNTSNDNWDFYLMAPLTLPDIGTIAELTDTATVFDQLFPADSLFRQLQLTIGKFAITLDKENGHLSAFRLGIQMPSTVTILQEILSIADIELKVDIIEPFDSTRRKISGYLAGTITFATVSAQISCTLEEGMVLTGTIPAMQLSSMVKALTGKELAGEIPDVKCKEIYFSINTVTKAWSFKGKANADWDYANNGTPLHAELDIDIAKLSGGAVTARINVLVSGDVIICNDCKLHQLDLGFELKENHDWSASGSLKALLLGYEMSLQAAYQSHTLSLSWSGAENNEKKYVPLIASEGIGILGCSTLGLAISKQGAAATASLALEATGILAIDNYFTLHGAIVFRRDASRTVTMGFHANMDARQVDDNADIRLDIIIPADKQATSLSGAIREIDINKLAQLFLGKAALPAELPAVGFQDLSFSLKPYEGTFSFSGAAKVDWTFAEGQQVLHSEASLSVARTKNADGQLKIQGALKTSFTGEFAVIEYCNFQSFQLDVLLGQQQSPEIEGHARISLYDHQLDAVAGYKDNSLRLTADLDQLQLLNIDGVAGLEVDKLSFIYKRQQGNTSATWEMDATAAIKIEHLGSLAGTVQLFSSAERSGLKVTNTSAPLTISLPVPDQQLAFQFGFDHFSVFKTVTAGVSSWQMEAGLDFGIKGLPEKFCQLFGEKDLVKFQTTLRLQDGSFHIHLDKLIGPVAIPIPDIEKEGKPVSLGTAYLLISDLDIQLGREMGLSVVGGLRIPAALDHIFGDLSQPFFNAFDPARPDETTVQLKLGILGSKVEVKLLSSPIAAVKMENGWVKVDLGDCGKFRFTPPVFSLNGTSFAAAISVERESELAIPVSLLKKLLINKLQLNKVASLLPDKIPISNIRFFDDDRKLLIGPFIEALAPDGEVKDLLEAAIDAVNKSVAYLPDRLVNNYMQFSIPEQFHAKISVTGTGNVELSVGVGEHSDPIRVLYPMIVGPLPALGGMELRNLSFGSLFGGSLFSLALDATFDQFDILSLGAAAIAGWLPEASRQLLPDTRKFQQTLTIADLYAIIVYQTVVPIPIPLFYKHVGMDHYGLEGLHVHAHISFPKPEADLAEVFRILQNLKRFFTDPVYQLPESDEELPKHVNLVFTFEDSYIMLPGYLGGAVAGKKQGQLLRINAAKMIAKVLNTIKFFSLRRLIEAIPVEYRIAHITSAGQSRLLDFNFELAYALTTPGEYAGKQEVIQSLQLANETIDRFFTQPLPANTEGIVFLGKGNIELWNTLKMSAHLGIIAVKDKGFVTHLQFYGAISDLLELSAKGIVKVDKQDHQNPVLLSGEVHIRSSLFQGHEILSAAFEYKNIEGKDYFVFDGFLNLFPEHLPVKLESVTRVHCTWSNDYFNISHAATTLTLPVFGTFNAQTTILISDSRQEFYTIVSLNNRQVTLQIRNEENEFLLRGEFDAFQIGSILRITDFNDTFEDGRYKGAEIYILTDKVAGKLRVFYLDGRITFLGLHAGVRIVVMDNAWSFSLSEGLRINRLQSSFLLNCTMAPDLGRFDGNAIFKVGLDLSISRKSFWIWFFGWHEIVVFRGIEWYGQFESNLSIKVYNPNTYASTFDYDRELDIVVENIAINIAEMARKQQELDEKKNSVSKKHDEIKDHTAKREEVLKRIKELQPKLLNMQYIYRLFEARESKGSGDEWLPAYNYAWNTFEAAAVDYLDTLSMLGYSTEDQLSFYMEQLAYLDKVYDYIAAYGHRSWGYNINRIRQVLETGQAPDYDIVLQFVLKVDGLKKAHMRKYRIVYTPAPGANEMIQLQERCTNLNILDYLFDAREKKGSDPDWGNDYNRARTELMTAVNAYIAWVENQGWNSDDQYALLSSRLSFLDKIKENTAVYGSQLFGYTLDGINRAMETADTSQNDIVYQLMYEVEMAKRDAFNRQLGLKKFEYTAVVGRSAENGFGYNMEYHQEDVENGLLNTDEGIYEFLEKEIISYQIVIRKLQEQEKAIRAKKAQIEAARGQALRFELQLQMGLNINGYELSLPDISILVAPEKLEDILGNVSGHVFQLVKDNLWSVVIDLFTGRGIRSRSLRGEGELPSLKYSYIRHGDTTVHRGGQRRLMMQERTPPPEGYDPEYDLTVYIE